MDVKNPRTRSTRSRSSVRKQHYQKHRSNKICTLRFDPLTPVCKDGSGTGAEVDASTPKQRIRRLTTQGLHYMKQPVSSRSTRKEPLTEGLAVPNEGKIRGIVMSSIM